MQAHDFDEFRGLVQGVAKIFPRKQLDDDTVQFYWRALKDQPIEIVRQCVANWQRYGKRFPVPGDLRPATEKPAIVKGDDAAFQHALADNLKHWDQVIADEGDMGRLKLADALLGRYYVEDPSGMSIRDKVDFLRNKVAQILRRADAKTVFNEPNVVSMVRQLFGEPGFDRLRDRAKAGA